MTISPEVASGSWARPSSGSVPVKSYAYASSTHLGTLPPRPVASSGVPRHRLAGRGSGMSPDAILRPKLSKNTSRLQRQAVEILSVCCRSRMRRYARRGAVEAMPSKALPFRPPMVGLGGLEPPTSPLSGVRSNHLSYRPTGGASRDRTDDPLLAKQVLSQLSYGPVGVCLHNGHRR